jgi:hypothetical protein
MIDQGEIGFLRGNRQDPATLLEAGRYAILHEFHEGFDGREACVPCPGAIAPLGLEMGEKVHDQRSIELLKGESRGHQMQALAGEGKQKLKRLGIAVTHMPTGTTLMG